jgi:hypothetical protein
MPNGSSPEVADLIKAEYVRWMGNMNIMGDSTGRNRSALVRGNLNHYRVFKDTLDLHDDDIRVPKDNPALSDSRVLCNSVLKNANVYITKGCPKTIKDIGMAMVDNEGDLIKNQTYPCHHFDTFRYFLHGCYEDFIKKPDKYRQ